MPFSQFFAVRSLTPVHFMIIFVPLRVDPNSTFKAEAITCANSASVSLSRPTGNSVPLLRKHVALPLLLGRRQHAARWHPGNNNKARPQWSLNGKQPMTVDQTARYQSGPPNMSVCPPIISNTRLTIRRQQFALTLRWGFEIVRTYADEEKAAFKLAGEISLQLLLADIDGDNVDFLRLFSFMM